MPRLAILALSLLMAVPAAAQVTDALCHATGGDEIPSRDRSGPTPSGLANTFDGLFSHFLRDALQLAGNPGQHGTHYLEAACIAESVVVPALSSFIASNITSFPSSTPQIGVTYDFSTGVPVRQVESFGPIFSETPGTIGRNRLTLGANVSVLTLDRVRGEPLAGVEFNFVHLNVEGETRFESDLLVVRPRLNVDATIYGLFANYGITDRLEVGVAIPVVSVRLEGRAEAQIFPYSGGNPNLHIFGGTLDSPLLQADYSYERAETFVPAVDVRAKVQIPTQGASLGVIGTLSIPASTAGSLLGERRLGGRLAIIGSTVIFGDLTPHVNVAYDRRGTAGETDVALVNVGLDANLSPKVNLAGALLGSIPLGSSIRFYSTTEALGAPGSAVQVVNTHTGIVEEQLSTIGDDGDATLLLSVGSRFAPTEQVQGFLNVIVPVLSGGLQSTLVPTLGVSVSL